MGWVWCFPGSHLQHRAGRVPPGRGPAAFSQGRDLVPKEHRGNVGNFGVTQGCVRPQFFSLPNGKIPFFPSLCLNYRASSGNPLSNRRAVSPSLRITGLKWGAAHGEHPPASSHQCTPPKNVPGFPTGSGCPGWGRRGRGDAAHSWRAGYIWSGFQRRSRPCSTPAGP